MELKCKIRIVVTLCIGMYSSCSNNATHSDEHIFEMWKSDTMGCRYRSIELFTKLDDSISFEGLKVDSVIYFLGNPDTSLSFDNSISIILYYLNKNCQVDSQHSSCFVRFQFEKGMNSSYSVMCN
jgi:hypothetical protein